METITRNCRSCGKEFNIYPKQQEKFREKDMELPTRCISCRAKNRAIEYKPCKDCEVPFPTTELEREWYYKKGFNEPERCLECRTKRREEKKNNGHKIKPSIN